MLYRGQGLTALMLGTAIVFAAGCTNKDDTDTGETDTDTDSDTDSDTDTDTDSDTDTDTEEDTLPASFAGSQTYEYSYDGANICDLEIGLTGTKFEGGCIDCDFAFLMDATITADNSGGDCTPYVGMTFLPDADGLIIDPILVHYPVYAGYYEDYNEVLMTGWGYDLTSIGYGVYDSPYRTFTLSFEGSEGGTFSRTGDDIEWTYHLEGVESVRSFAEECPEDYTGFDVLNMTGGEGGTYDKDPAAGDGTGGGTPMAEDVPCNATLMDTWTFIGTGGIVDVNVQTVADDSAVDLAMYVNGPATAGDDSTCDGTIHFADDSYDCAFVPASEYKCPSLAFTTEMDGEYTVIVLGTNAQESDGSFPDCDIVDTAAYTIRIAAGSEDLEATLADDVAAAVEYPYSYDVAGSGTITP